MKPFAVIITGYNDRIGWTPLYFSRQEMMEIFGVDPAGCESHVIKLPKRYLELYRRRKR